MEKSKIWHYVREYINGVSDGVITRKHLLKYMQNNCNIPYSKFYIDTLRNQLEKCGYLCKMKTQTGAPIAGKFFRVKLIDDDLSIGLLRKEYEIALGELYPDIKQ